MRAHRFLALIGAGLFLSTGCANPGEYGDAPDGGATGYPSQFAQTGAFPTLAASDGARTDAAGDARLGPEASLEDDADDAADPDGRPNLDPVNTDADDGLVGLTALLTQIPPPAQLEVLVTGPDGGLGGDFLLNVLIDLDLDGEWGGTAANNEPEWVVQNFPVSVAPGDSIVVTPPLFAFANGNRLPDGAWMRVALTSERVADGDWDGTGRFASGEIEDHVIRLPQFKDTKPPIPVMVCPVGGNPVRFPPGALQVQFQCSLTNVGAAGDIDYSLTRIDGGVVAVGPPVDPNPGQRNLAAGAAVNLTFTATRAGPLPSRWRYRATAVDPPSVVDAEGVTLGYGDSEGEVLFVGEGEPQRQQGPDVEQRQREEPGVQQREPGP